MRKKKTSPQESLSVSLARQPVFDEKRHLWGYELFCVSNKGDAAFACKEEGGVAIQLASSANIGLDGIVGREKKIIVDFNERNIFEKLPYALPPGQAAVRVPAQIHVTQSVLDSLQTLKSDRYMIAIDGATANAKYISLFDMADIVCVDITGRQKEDLREIIVQGKNRDALLLAERVETQAMLETCRDLGFDLFCGHFFKYPENVSIRKISTGEISRFQIFEIIEKKDADLDKLAEIIQTDVTISLRLLSYLNSAAFGFTQKIKSIRHAISLLGWRKIKNWLRVLLLTDMSQGKDIKELVFLAGQRAKFLERISSDHDYWGFDPDTLSLLGLFSLLDSMLDTPMDQIVKHLPLEEKLKAALCKESNNEYLPLLSLAECLEEAKWEEGEAMTRQLSLDLVKVKEAFYESVNWANELTTMEET